MDSGTYYIPFCEKNKTKNWEQMRREDDMSFPQRGRWQPPYPGRRLTDEGEGRTDRPSRDCCVGWILGQGSSRTPTPAAGRGLLKEKARGCCKIRAKPGHHCTRPLPAAQRVVMKTVRRIRRLYEFAEQFYAIRAPVRREGTRPSPSLTAPIRTRLSASFFGAFCLVLLALRQQGFVVRNKNPSNNSR